MVQRGLMEFLAPAVEPNTILEKSMHFRVLEKSMHFRVKTNLAASEEFDMDRTVCLHSRLNIRGQGTIHPIEFLRANLILTIMTAEYNEFLKLVMIIS